MSRPVPYGAVAKATSTLSETASKTLLARYGVPFAPEHVVADPDAAVEAAHAVGFPVALKLNGDRIAHKTERGLVRLNVASDDAVRAAAAELLGAARPDDGDVDVLVAPMLRGNRELIAGLTATTCFGPTVMLGVGGVLAEAVSDVVFRLVPITLEDAHEMIDDLHSPVAARPVPRRARRRPNGDGGGATRPVGSGRRRRSCSRSISTRSSSWTVGRSPSTRSWSERERHQPIGSSRSSNRRASSSPAHRRIPASSASCHCTTCSPPGTRAACSPRTCTGEEVLGVSTVASIDDLPDGAADLVFVCTPAAANLELLKACAARRA